MALQRRFGDTWDWGSGGLAGPLPLLDSHYPSPVSRTG